MWGEFNHDATGYCYRHRHAPNSKTRHGNKLSGFTESAYQQVIMNAINEIRQHPRQCGQQYFAAVAPLRWNSGLPVLLPRTGYGGNIISGSIAVAQA